MRFYRNEKHHSLQMSGCVCVWDLFTVHNFLKCKIGLTEIEQKHYSLFICRKLFRTCNFARVFQTRQEHHTDFEFIGVFE